jgi:hypothetical protein
VDRVLSAHPDVVWAQAAGNQPGVIVRNPGGAYNSITVTAFRIYLNQMRDLTDSLDEQGFDRRPSRDQHNQTGTDHLARSR